MYCLSLIAWLINIYIHIYIFLYIYIFAYIYTHIHIHIRSFAPSQVHKSFCGFTHPGTCVVSKSLCIVRSVHSSLLELLCGSLHVGLFRMLCSHHVSSCTTLCLSCCSLAGVTGSVLSSYSDASEGRLRAPAAAAVGSGALRWAWGGGHGIGEPRCFPHRSSVRSGRYILLLIHNIRYWI